MSSIPLFHFSSPILITASLKQEIWPLIKKLDAQSYKADNDLNLYSAELKEKQLFFLITGVGGKQVQYHLKKVLQRIKIDTIISIGMAGAVDKEHSVGDNVLSKKVFLENHKGENEIDCNGVKRKIHCIDLESFKNIGVKIVENNLTVPEIYRSKEKKALGNHFSLVDMETFFIAKVAKEFTPKTKIFSIRAISDELNSKIPPLGSTTVSLFNKLLMVLINSLKKPEYIYWYPKTFLNCQKSINCNTNFLYRLITLQSQSS